jgi:hemerythrin-like domain-containing protein
MNTATTLMNTHRVIEEVLSCLELLALQGVVKRKLDGAAAREALDILETYADGGPPGTHEHALDRNYFRAIVSRLDRGEAGPAEHVERFAWSALDCVRRLRDHIFKQDQLLFVLADHPLTNQDHEALLRSLEVVEVGERNAGARERYLTVANEFLDRFDGSQSVVGVEDGHACSACGHHRDH